MKLKYKDLLAGQVEIFKVRLPNPEILEREFDETELARAFGLTLKTLRNYKKMSLNALSQEVGIPNPTINRYENAVNIPTIPQAMKLSSYFGMSVELFTVFGLANINDGMDIVEYYEKIISAFERTKREVVIARAKKH